MSLIESIKMQSPSEIPVGVGMLPAMWKKYGAELQRIVDEYPQFFGGRKVDYEHPETYIGGTYAAGEHVDEWGCVWSNIDDGMEAYVTGHPVKSEDDVFALKIPANRDGRLPHGFMYLRLLDLCGFELAMTMFAEEDEAIDTLISKVLEYNMYQIDAIMPRIGDIVYFGDDLGMQTGLAIGAERWRKYLKPCFSKMYKHIKEKRPDTLIYMHTDGCIWEIMPDLMECGVDMINPQFRANGVDNLYRVCRKNQIIPINLDLDRQLFPFATPSELDDHVRNAIETFYMKEGGLGINIELNYEVPLENVVALLDAAEKYRHYKK